MACVIKEANDLLASVDDLVVAKTAGIGQGHGAALGIFVDALDADEQILDFAGLLTDGLRQNNAEAIGVGALGAADDGHITTICTATGDDLIAGEDRA